jgi:formylglycine-generating enzyme required for sulfatase activity
MTAFQLDRKEVTIGRYRQFLEIHPDYQRPEGWIEEVDENQRFQGDELKPVTQVGRADALAYCNWLGKTLPTEAQWEFAARGPDAHPYPWGASPTPSCGYAVRQLVNSDRDSELCARGGEWKPPCSATDGNNAQGVCDLIGNVREWTLDGYRFEVYSAQIEDGLPLNDPFIPFEDGMAGTLRGAFGAAYVRANGRNPSSSIGFRCAQAIP